LAYSEPIFNNCFLHSRAATFPTLFATSINPSPLCTCEHYEDDELDERGEDELDEHDNDAHAYVGDAEFEMAQIPWLSICPFYEWHVVYCVGHDLKALCDVNHVSHEFHVHLTILKFEL